MTKSEFIEFVADVAVSDWNKRHIILPSVVIAQACKESGFGTSQLAVAANAIFGIKLNGWTGKAYNKEANEMEPDGSISTHPDTLWRAYDSWEQSIIDHSSYIATRKVGNQTEPNFKAVIGETNVNKAIAGLVGDSIRQFAAALCTDEELKKYVLEGTTQFPYFTGHEYAQSLYTNYILKYDLTKYDVSKEPVKPNIVLQTSTNKTTLKNNRKIEYIVLHYTAGTTSKAGTALNTANYFSKSAAEASADFIVDDSTIVQYNPDILNRYCWHSGGNKYSTLGGSLYGIAKNANSIGIEICSNNDTGKVTQANDKHWYFNQESLNNALNLVKWLMHEHGIDVSHVIRHYDVTGKPCPGIVGWNADTGSEAAWLQFKSLLGSDQEAPEPEQKYWRVQVGAYSKIENAEMMKAKMIQSGHPAFIKQVDGLYKVQAGAFSVSANAQALQARLMYEGFSAFIVYS